MKLPDDIDSCAALAGDLLSAADALASVRSSTQWRDESALLARDAAVLGHALAEYTDRVRRLRGEGRAAVTEDSGSGPSLAPAAPVTHPATGDTWEHRAATEMGKARSRLRRAALVVGRTPDR